uniref:Uncharacterized protein n=1 Tax=Rhizophora mucronata TaxID=61149 RepID=A0A2P2ND69_RHIMU
MSTEDIYYKSIDNHKNKYPLLDQTYSMGLKVEEREIEILKGMSS